MALSLVSFRHGDGARVHGQVKTGSGKELGKQTVLRLLEAMDKEHPAAAKGRKQLSRYLFN